MAFELQKLISECKVLVVGAGGVGCELIKNLVMTGFLDIELIDLDTIDVSNLNRQFLFRKEHVGQSKAKVAQASAIRFNPNVNILARHDTITNPDYDVDYFRKFDVVLNALDNRAARNHVNRMCLAADVPLVESGSSGYLGQVTVIKKGKSECYECQTKPTQKSYPSCTIRNTPAEPIHCIIWAKHLFSQLFSESDEDNEVSPDTEDPAAIEDGNIRNEEHSSSNNHIKVSTRSWAESVGYDPQMLLNKLFHDDIIYLLRMDKLWQKRRPPVPLNHDGFRKANESTAHANNVACKNILKDQIVWNLQECITVFLRSVSSLKRRLDATRSYLIWDKDDDVAMDFVTSSANIRAHIFGIQLKSRFDIKSMAGNIIPAIATTNAIVAGLIVTEAIKVIQGRLDLCRTVVIYKNNSNTKNLIIPCKLEKPNESCYVCSSKPEIYLRINVNHLRVKHLEDEILKKRLGMIAPDVEVDDGTGRIIISSEEGEIDDIGECALSQFGIRNGSQLKADDFLQNYTLRLNVVHDNSFLGMEFEIEGEIPTLEKQATKESQEILQLKRAADDLKYPEPKRRRHQVIDSDDDLIFVNS